MIVNLLPYDKNATRLYYNTYYCALHNIAEKYHLPYVEYGMRTLDNIMNFTFQLPECEDPVIFVTYHPNFGIEFKEHILKKCPRAKIILTGSDTVYYEVEDSLRMKPDVFIDTMEDQVELAKKVVPSEFLVWTLSEDIIQEIAEVPDAVRDLAGICLCQNSPDRNTFFYRVMDKLDNGENPIAWGLNQNDPQKIYKYFKRSKICIGYSGPSPGFGDDKKPSRKGMRDWLGVAAGCLFLQDDFHPLPVDIFPCYKYKDPIDCANMMRFFIDRNIFSNQIIEYQQQWLKDNSMEKQLEKILLKNNLL